MSPTLACHAEMLTNYEALAAESPLLAVRHLPAPGIKFGKALAYMAETHAKDFVNNIVEPFVSRTKKFFYVRLREKVPVSIVD